jgi:hypothetical protein
MCTKAFTRGMKTHTQKINTWTLINTCDETARNTKRKKRLGYEWHEWSSKRRSGVWGRIGAGPLRSPMTGTSRVRGRGVSSAPACGPSLQWAFRRRANGVLRNSSQCRSHDATKSEQTDKVTRLDGNLTNRYYTQVNARCPILSLNEHRLSKACQ